MCHYPSRNYRVICVVFWSFPYLIWQAFGHWSGFLVGVIVAVTLTVLLNDLFRVGNWNMAFSARQRSLPSAEPRPRRQEAEPYQRGYRVEAESYHAEPYLYLAGDSQLQYEETQALYPEMPPMERK